jgi:hypothetical protein
LDPDLWVLLGFLFCDLGFVYEVIGLSVVVVNLLKIEWTTLECSIA